MIKQNTTVIDLNEYHDIDLNKFIDWFEKKFFKTVIINNDTNWFNDKYDVNIIVHKDFFNNKLGFELELVDVTDCPVDPCLEEVLKEIEYCECGGILRRHHSDTGEIYWYCDNCNKRIDGDSVE